MARRGAVLTAAEVARALAAHPRWEWRAGMRTASGYRVPEGGGVRTARPPDWRGEWLPPVPDLTDDGTSGFLLGALRAARPLARLLVFFEPDRDGGVWTVETYEAPVLGEAAGRAVLASWGPA